jgi:SPP1 gp7 family putative phage head morphogenesis protein
MPQHPRPIERRYARLLLELVAFVRERVERFIVPVLPALVTEGEALRPQLDGPPPKITNLAEQVQNEVEQRSELTSQAVKEIGIEIAEFSATQVDKVLVALDLQVFYRRPWLSDQLDSFARENAALIKTLARDTVTQIETTIQREFRKGTDHRKIARDIRDRLDVAQNRARFIARDQVAKLNGQLTRLTQTEMGIAEYIWQTAMDERVRDTHRAKQGKRFRWDSPPSDTGHPSEDFNCRCVALPVVTPLLEESRAVVS